ncbi:MAG: hypothetical protein RBU23_05345 [Candidatus Auribacterota bacterium]|jgi:hypothetical protein|nr:hypothetical protein [Candidatus Auribacterota bacterium]
MGDVQVNSIQTDGISGLNQWNQIQQNKVPVSKPPQKSFEETLRETQSKSKEKTPVKEESSEWPQIKARERFPLRSEVVEHLPDRQSGQIQEDQDQRAWPAPYNASQYRAKSIREFREIQAQHSRRIPKGEEGSPAYTPQEARGLNDMQIYKQDQLFNIPGGDFYFLKPDGSMEYNPEYDHSDFGNRVGKDLQDAAANLKYAFDNLGEGAKYTYIDKEGRMQTAQKTGLLKTLGNFVKNVFDGLNFGKNETENPPESAIQKIGYAGKKVFLDGFVKNIILGIPQAMLNAGENLFAATLNAMEAVPDATIGTTDIGRKLTTTVFDNAQVTLSYITDVMPTGEAWLRVHAAGSKDDGFRLPYLYNIKTPQQGLEDMRWAHVRNTPFRKVIETVGCIFSDMLTFHGLPILSLESEVRTGDAMTKDGQSQPSSE